MKNRSKFGLFTLSALAILVSRNAFARAGEVRNFEELESEIKNLRSKYRPEDILLAFDIDNTVLSLKQDLGSEQWFNWQKELIAENSPYRVADTIEDMMVIQSKIYYLSKVEPTEESAPKILEGLQKKGHPVITLTSRSTWMRDFTARMLSEAGYDFRRRPLFSKVGFPSTYLPSMTIFSKDEQERFQLTEPRAVSYMDGMYLTSGMHKGAMLRELLWRTRTHVKAIVFLDDTQRHINGMEDAFAESRIETVSLLYTGKRAELEKFKQGDKSHVVRQWKLLKSVMDVIFGKTKNGTP